MKIIRNLAYILACTVWTLSACELTFINDTDQTVVIVDKDGSISMILPSQNEGGNQSSAVFGNPDKRAHFRLFMPTAANKNYFSASKVVEQIKCSASHSIQLTISDILKGTVDTEIWKVTPYSVKPGTKREFPIAPETGGISPDAHSAHQAQLAHVLKNYMLAGSFLTPVELDPDTRTAISETPQQLTQTSGNLYGNDPDSEITSGLDYGEMNIPAWKRAEQRGGYSSSSANCPSGYCP